MQRISSRIISINLSGFNKVGVPILGEERVRKLSEEAFEQTGDSCHIVTKVRGVAEIQLGIVRLKCIEHMSKAIDLANISILSVDAFHIETEQVDGLDALKDDNGDSRLITSEEVFQRHTKHSAATTCTECCRRRLKLWCRSDVG